MWRFATVRRMEIAWATLGVGAFGGFVAALCASIGLRWGISRRCYRLELGLLDLQQMLASVKGRESAEKRWSKAKTLEEEISQMRPEKVVKERQFANDFFDMGESNGISR